MTSKVYFSLFPFHATLHFKVKRVLCVSLISHIGISQKHMTILNTMHHRLHYNPNQQFLKYIKSDISSFRYVGMSRHHFYSMHSKLNIALYCTLNPTPGDFSNETTCETRLIAIDYIKSLKLASRRSNTQLKCCLEINASLITI